MIASENRESNRLYGLCMNVLFYFGQLYFNNFCTTLSFRDK